MSRAEADAARPLRLKSVIVGPNDNVERLASRMAVGDKPLERFRVLNGLDAGDKLKPGDKVKIVVE
jgi:predicted Zn-dependent protease